jgi:hypothetical protein
LVVDLCPRSSDTLKSEVNTKDQEQIIKQSNLGDARTSNTKNIIQGWLSVYMSVYVSVYVYVYDASILANYYGIVPSPVELHYSYDQLV